MTDRLITSSVSDELLFFFTVAGRTILASIKDSLQRITYDGDPLQFLVETTTYQPFISLFHQIELIKDDPSLQGIRACSRVLHSRIVSYNEVALL